MTKVEQAYEKEGLDFTELREKRIEELEKENKELKTVKIPQLERKIASIRGAHSVDCKKLNAKIEQCERQKKLIAEFKQEIKDSRDLAEAAYMQGVESYKMETDEQLTRAKEIIEGLMRFCRCFAQHHTEDIRYKEAEQFLKGYQNENI